MPHILKNQDAWQRMLKFNQRVGFPHQEWEMRRIHKKWKSLGKLAKQPASLRGAENHN